MSTLMFLYVTGPGRTVEDNFLKTFGLDHIRPMNCTETAGRGFIVYLMRHLLLHEPTLWIEPDRTKNHSRYFLFETLRYHEPEYKAIVMRALEALVGPLKKKVDCVSSEAAKCERNNRANGLSAHRGPLRHDERNKLLSSITDTFWTTI